jgi:hypothetical protein
MKAIPMAVALVALAAPTAALACQQPGGPPPRHRGDHFPPVQGTPPTKPRPGLLPERLCSDDSDGAARQHRAQ